MCCSYLVVFYNDAMHIDVSIARQTLRLTHSTGDSTEYRISTAKNGPGEQKESFCTPRGQHIVRAKIGAGAPIGAVFRGRRPTGERYTPELGVAQPNRDWILTRILWLSGCEIGKNRLGQVDTMQRYIYIHGTPASEPMGQPASHGCIRMRNEDVVELFVQTPVGTPVLIE